MAEFIGRSGADAVAKALHKICHVLTAYSNKLNVAIDLATAAEIITIGEATVAKTFLGTANTVCDIFEKVAGNSGF